MRINKPEAAGTVSKISFDFGVEVVVDSTLLRFEGPAFFNDLHGKVTAFDAENPGHASKLLITMLHTDVAIIEENSSLFVRSSSEDVWLEVPPSPEFEAWSLSKPDGSHTVCGPDGTVSRWPLEPLG